MPRGINALSLAHAFIKKHVRPGDFCIDATAGRGYDTALLCELVGDSGSVLAFDVQQEALDSTSALLSERQLSQRARLVLDSHSNMDHYAAPESASCIVFNFGWLPAGDHSIFTRAQTSVPAVEKALSILRPGGVMSLSIYYGRDNGLSERDALLEFLATVDYRRYTILTGNFINRPNNPAIPVFVLRES